MLRLLLAPRVAVLLLAPATAAADGTFSVKGSTIVYNGDAGVDQIAGFDTGTSIRFTRFGGATLGGGLPCILSPDQQSVDCPKGGVTAVLLNLGAGDDVAAVSRERHAAGDLRRRRRPRRAVRRRRHRHLQRRLRATTTSSPATGAPSRSTAAPATTPRSATTATRANSCEEIEGDADGDGVRRPADCDDTNPGIHPGAVDTPDDRVDQDCSGTDATNLDATATARPGRRTATTPTARSTRARARWSATASTRTATPRSRRSRRCPGIVGNLWTASGSRTVNLKLTAKDFPKGTRIELRCTGRGCPSRKRHEARAARAGRP